MRRYSLYEANIIGKWPLMLLEQLVLGFPHFAVLLVVTITVAVKKRGEMVCTMLGSCKKKSTIHIHITGIVGLGGQGVPLVQFPIPGEAIHFLL